MELLWRDSESSPTRSLNKTVLSWLLKTAQISLIMKTEVLMFSLDDFKFKRIANVSYFVFSINSEDFNRDGREDLLLTGYDPRLDLGKITLLENTSEGFRKAFECTIENKTFDAFVSDVNKDCLLYTSPSPRDRG